MDRSRLSTGDRREGGGSPDRFSISSRVCLKTEGVQTLFLQEITNDDFNDMVNLAWKRRLTWRHGVDAPEEKVPCTQNGGGCRLADGEIRLKGLKNKENNILMFTHSVHNITTLVTVRLIARLAD